MNREELVNEFIVAAGGDLSFETVWKCFEEENIEMQEAAMRFHELIASDVSDEVKASARAAFVKEWADVQYTLSQIAIFYNINGEEAIQRVAENNMTKVVDGKVVRRDDGKIMKPDGYRPPDMGGL